ncbi:putative nucleotidyltransferase-like protein [Alkalispirillum mobile]|uniref:Putative nucleotidyltransferase-like protein n=1 Tax=Alkalispirillum mobile TaxID=85925 RepID=A0A498CEZ9_9GAMM|nr:putative nucleotidyltransferase-like protein [Alkalispirillum mobile]
MLTDLNTVIGPVVEGLATGPPAAVADLAQALGRAEGQPALQRLAGEFVPLQASLAHSGMAGTAQARLITGLVDTLTRRLIALAEAELAEPAPGPWAWLACGSQGRAEQTVHTDQDNALVYADGLPKGADDWYRALAQRVTGGLDACGLPHCPGGVSPANREWRRSVSGWRQAMRSVVEAPERKAVMLATHYLDLRGVAGDPSLFEPVREEALAAAAANRRFIARLSDGATRPRPPWHALGRIWTPWVGEHAGRVDLKQGAILPLVQLARVYAVRAGVSARHTLERLEQAAAAGALAEDDAERLMAGYRAVIATRARLHAEAIRAGRPLHNQVPVADLTGAEYRAVRGAFRAILRRQRVLRQAVIREGL